VNLDVDIKKVNEKMTKRTTRGMKASKKYEKTIRANRNNWTKVNF
jgi:hypothetical protein